jgi:hypothetical protein
MIVQRPCPSSAVSRRGAATPGRDADASPAPPRVAFQLRDFSKIFGGSRLAILIRHENAEPADGDSRTKGNATTQAADGDSVGDRGTD